MTLIQILIAILAAVLTVCLPFFLRGVFMLLGAKTKNITLATMLTEIGSAVASAVETIAQTYTDALKEAAADGKLTKDEQRAALAKALALINKNLSLDATAWIRQRYDNITDYLTTEIEAYIRKNKVTYLETTIASEATEVKNE